MQITGSEQFSREPSVFSDDFRYTSIFSDDLLREAEFLNIRPHIVLFALKISVKHAQRAEITATVRSNGARYIAAILDIGQTPELFLCKLPDVNCS